jgi:hypothetical protein
MIYTLIALVLNRLVGEAKVLLSWRVVVVVEVRLFLRSRHIMFVLAGVFIVLVVGLAV